MMKRLVLPLLLLALASPAQALKLIVWDSEMQTKLGAGESSGNRLSVQLVRDYSGPVKVIFSQSNDEKSKNAFAGLQSSYDGLLKNGQLSLLTDAAPSANTMLRMSVPAPDAAAPTAPNPTPLSKFLQQYKLTLVGQPTGHVSEADLQLLSNRSK